MFFVAKTEMNRRNRESILTWLNDRVESSNIHIVGGTLHHVGLYVSRSKSSQASP